MQAFVGNSIVGARAYVLASAYSDDDQRSHEFTYYLNGEPLGTVTTPPAAVNANTDDRTVKKCFEVNVGLVRFAFRVPGTTPSAGQNFVSVSGNGVVPPLECERCNIGAYVHSITIEAMAPVVLVHGIRSGPQAFDQFEPVLNDARIPTFRVTLGEGSIPRIGGGALKQQVAQAASEFGTNHVHIVAHSKGGLWSRYMMQEARPEVAVYSLTTLDTPHLGSVLADLVILARQSVLNRTLQTLASLSPLLSQSVPDLSVSSMRDSNPVLPLVPSMTVAGSTNDVRYYAHAADANLNSDMDAQQFGIIQPNECTMMGTSIDPSLYRFLQQYREASSFRDSQGRVRLASPLLPNNPPYPLNSFVVTTNSAWCSGVVATCNGLMPVPAADYAWKASHETIHSAEVARYVRLTLGIALEAALEQ